MMHSIVKQALEADKQAKQENDPNPQPKLQSNMKTWREVASLSVKEDNEVNQDGRRRSSIRKSISQVVNIVKASVGMEMYDNKRYRLSNQFTTMFNLPSRNRRVTIYEEDHQEEEQGTASNNILQELPHASNRELKRFISKDLIGNFINHHLFKRFMTFIVMLNTILICFETQFEAGYSLDPRVKYMFKILDDIFLAIFTCEIMLKWFSNFTKFWKNYWNLLDFVIVAALLVLPVFFDNTSSKYLKVLRIMRAFRSLRSISALGSLRIVIKTIVDSIPDMADILLLLTILMLMWSIIGITLFEDYKLVTSFNSLGEAMVALFTCLTQDGWVEILEQFDNENEHDAIYPGGFIFMYIFLFIGAFIFANLVVAVMVTNLEYAVKEVAAEELLEKKSREIKGISVKEDPGEEVQTVTTDGVSENVFRCQRPLVTPDLSGMTIPNIENYLLVISAMEQNLMEYKKIISELNRIFTEVCEANRSAIQEGVLSEYSVQTPRGSLNPSIGKSHESVKNLDLDGKRLSLIKRASNAGDLMSMMMNMEEASLINSKKRNSINEMIKTAANLNFEADRHGMLQGGGASSGKPNRRKSSAQKTLTEFFTMQY